MSPRTKRTKTNAGLRNLRSLPISDGNLVIYAQDNGQLLASCVIKIPSSGVTNDEFLNYYIYQTGEVASALTGSSVVLQRETPPTLKSVWRSIVSLIKSVVV